MNRETLTRLAQEWEYAMNVSALRYPDSAETFELVSILQHERIVFQIMLFNGETTFPAHLLTQELRRRKQVLP